jgi:serine/threonine-protein kinase HipA
LLRAADAVSRDGPDDMAAIKTLLDAGTGSLGGARPKASVRDGDRLLIAKFPHHNDRWSVIAWEKTALDLAEAGGVTVPSRQMVSVDGHPVLLLDRFDREGAHRIGYIIAMTLLEADDGSVGTIPRSPKQSRNTALRPLRTFVSYLGESRFRLRSTTPTTT